ncbi:hypothetical protein ACKKBF_B10130 [Auxenochlorella protothecoides x Auxenochlorella symbiontica]
MEHPDQESVDPNEVGRPRPAAAKRRMSAIDGTPTRLQPKRKAKDRRRVSFAPSLTSVQFFNKDEDNSGELAPGRSRFGVPDIPQGPWEDQEPSATVTAEVPPPSPMDVSMELTEPWQRETQPADEVTASVPSLGDLLSSEPDATESITAAVPGLSSLVDESREEVALTQAPEAGPVPDGADMDVTLLDGLAGGSGAQGQEEESVQPSPGLSEDGNEQGPALASKWGFNPGCEDTMDLNLELHGRMIMGDHTYGRLYGDVTGSAASLEEGEAGAEEEDGEEEEERLGEQDGGARLGEQGGLSPERNTGLPAPDRDLDAGAGRAEESDLDSIEPACSPPPEHPRSLEVSPTAEERRALGPMQDDQVPASEPVWTAPAFLPPYMMASGSQEGDRAQAHPALVTSPELTGSTLQSLDTRRSSLAGQRRLSITSRRTSVGQGDMTGALLLDDETANGGRDDTSRSLSHAALRRRSDASALAREMTEGLLADDALSSPGPAADLAGLNDRLARLARAPRDASGVGAPEAAVGGFASPLPGVQGGDDDARGPVSDSPGASAGLSPGVATATAALLQAGGTTRLLLGAATPGRGLPAPGTGTDGLGATAALLRDDSAALLRDDSAALLDDQEPSLSGFDPPPDLPPGSVTRHWQAARGLEAARRGAVPGSEAPEAAAGGWGGGTDHEAPAAIPGGPLLPRTPLSGGWPVAGEGTGSVPGRRAASAPRPRAASATPLGAGPGARPLSAGPGAPVPPSSAHSIPGGPRLARTPLRDGGDPAASARGTPATSVPGSALGSRRAGGAPTPSWSGAGAAGARSGTPRSIDASHGDGAPRSAPRAAPAPSPPPSPSPAPITFQDFARLTDLRFLDNLRRGTSINYADLAPNAPPADLRGAYRLLGVVAPAAGELAQGVRTLAAEVAERRDSALAAEVAVGRANPRALRLVAAGGPGAERVRADVDLLRRVCRAKAVAVLKDVRVQMEESQSTRLAHAASALRADCAFVQSSLAAMDGLAASLAALARERGAAAAEREAGARRRAAAREEGEGARASLAALHAANAERTARLDAARAALEAQRQARDAAEAARDAAAAALAGAEAALEPAGGGAGQDRARAPRSAEVRRAVEGLGALQAVAGVRLVAPGGRAPESAALAFQVGGVYLLSCPTVPGPPGDLVLDLGLSRAPGPAREVAMLGLGAAVRGIEVVRAEGSGTDASSLRAHLPAPSSPAGRLATLQTLAARLSAAAMTVRTVERLLGACPSLAAVRAVPGAATAAAFPTTGLPLRLVFLHLAAGARVSVDVLAGPSATQFLGARVVGAPGTAQASSEGTLRAVEAAARSLGRRPALQALAGAVHAVLAGSAPAAATDFAGPSNFQNPLFAEPLAQC